MQEGVAFLAYHQEQRRRADGERVSGDQEGQPGPRAPDALVETQRAHWPTIHAYNEMEHLMQAISRDDVHKKRLYVRY